MNDNYEQSKSINSIELMALIHTVPIAVGILGMVRFVAEKAGHDAALSTLLSGVVTQAAILFMWLLLKRFCKYGIYEIHQLLFGKWIGKMLNLLFAGYCLAASFITLRTFTELVTTWMFPMIPIWSLTALFLVPIVHASFAGLRLLGRYAIMTFVLTIWILLLTYFPLQEGGVSHLFPIGSTGYRAIAEGMYRTALSLLGVELLLVYYPYVAHKRDVLPVSSIASWLTTLIYTTNVIVALIFFSPAQLQKTVWPMLTMFKHVQIAFIERFETIVIAIWLIRIVNTSGAYLWAGVEGLERSFSWNKGWIYIFLVPIVIILSQMIKGRPVINQILNAFSLIGLAVMIGYPLLIWIISLILRKKGDAT